MTTSGKRYTAGEIVGYDAKAKSDIKASKVVVHGLIAQNVDDIVLEQEKPRRVSSCG
jgi:hypothetical protein